MQLQYHSFDRYHGPDVIGVVLFSSCAIVCFVLNRVSNRHNSQSVYQFPTWPGRAADVFALPVVEKLSVAEYDKLSPEEQKAHDAAMAEQEAAEQAGTRDIPPYFVTLELIRFCRSSAL